MISELISKMENLEREMKRDLLIVKIDRTNPHKEIKEVFQNKNEGDGEYGE